MHESEYLQEHEDVVQCVFLQLVQFFIVCRIWHSKVDLVNENWDVGCSIEDEVALKILVDQLPDVTLVDRVVQVF